MDGAKDVTTLLLSTLVTLKLVDGSISFDCIEYCRVISALQYLSLTQSDISFAVDKSLSIHALSNKKSLDSN